MSMSMHVYGIRPPDKKWKKMKAVLDACAAAGIVAPMEAEEFFGHEEPDLSGVLISLENGAVSWHECVKKHRADAEEGFEIDISKLPKDVKFVRFVCAY